MIKVLIFLISSLDFGKSCIIFGVRNRLLTHTNNMEKDRVLGERPT